VAVNPELEVRTVIAEQLTREAFEPFGDVLAPEGLERLPIELYGGTFDSYRAGVLGSDRPVEFLVSRCRVREFRVHFLERHVELTQTFVPLGGAPFVVVVARPEARQEFGIPAFEEVRAFLVRGDVAVNLRRGTWHEPPFPLVDGTLMLFTSHLMLTRGLESGLDGRNEIDRQDVEKRNVTERAGYVLRVALP
jgi:ureidoglycolate lyase